MEACEDLGWRYIGGRRRGSWCECWTGIMMTVFRAMTGLRDVSNRREHELAWEIPFRNKRTERKDMVFRY